MSYLHLITQILLVFVFQFVVCAGLKFQIVALKKSHNGTNQTVKLCGSCPPGTEPDRECSEPFKTILQEVEPLNKILVSSCKNCSVGFYSAVHSFEKPCVPCTACPPNHTLVKKCTSSENAVCEETLFRTSDTRGYAFFPTPAMKLPTQPTTRKRKEETTKTWNGWTTWLLVLMLVTVTMVLMFVLIAFSIVFRRLKRKPGPNENKMEPRNKDIRPRKTHSSEDFDIVIRPMSSPENDYIEEFNPYKADEHNVEGIYSALPEKSINFASQMSRPSNTSYNDKEESYETTFNLVLNPAEVVRDSGVASEYSRENLRDSESETDEVFDDFGDGILFEETKVIGKEGGVIVVEGTSVRVTIPENAIEGEEQEIEVKVYIGQPNDWKQLKADGHAIDLPQVQLGPSGTKFNKPVEVVTQLNAYEDEEDVEYEFADGELSNNTVWLKATRASSKEKAKRLAVTEEPNVSFYVEDRYMYAYYMHFTLGRTFFKRFRKSKWLGASVYCDYRNFLHGRCNLIVIFFEQTVEGKAVLRENTKTLREVATSKEVKVEKGEPFSLKLDNVVGDWTVEQGRGEQVVCMAAFFDPEHLGKIAKADFILCSKDVADFSCCFFMYGNNNQLPQDLKAVVTRSDCQADNRSSMTSGYLSNHLESPLPEKVVSVDEFPQDDRVCLRMVFNKLADIVGAHYVQFARNMGIEDGIVDNCKHDHSGCKNICYEILKEWLNQQEDIRKEIIVDKLRKAAKATDLPYEVKFEMSQVTPSLPIETTV